MDWEKEMRMVRLYIYVFNSMIIGGIIPNTPTKLQVSLDHTTKNQIDKDCIGKRFRKSLEQVRTKQLM